MLFKKKKKGPVIIKLKPEQFCAVIEEKAQDCSHKFCILADSNHYTLLYKDGKFMGMPAPYGGAIFPFATDPTKRGSRGQKRQCHAIKAVALSKAFTLKVFWGTSTPFAFEDSKTNKAYEVGAHGVFFVSIDPGDAARNADMFYSKCLTQENANLFDTEKLRELLADAFVMHIGAKIQEHLEESQRSLETYVGLMPSEILKISQELCPKMKDIFGSFGLTIEEKASSGSILEGLMVNEVVRS